MLSSDYVQRFKALPGITGLAQVKGARGLSDTPEKVRRRVELDLDYVRDWSLTRDLCIMAATLLVLVHDKNAF
jgi:putative colanic acid biosynthesis UDP-glucose lipid carrier transferase